MSSHQRRGGLQLSRTTKGIQNSRRSIRGLGSSGNNNLGDELARIDSKKGSGPKPTIADDLSIDDSVPSVAEARGRKERDDNSGSSRRKSKESLRVPRRGSLSTKSDHVRSSTSRPSNDLSGSKSDHVRGSGRMSNDLSKSDHVRRPAASHDLSGSKSDHVRSFRRRTEEDSSDLDLSKSETRKKTGLRRSNTFNGKSTNAVQGIYKLLDSMEASSKESKDATPRPRHALPRRSKTADEGGMAQRIGLDGNRKSLEGIRNLLDKKDSHMKDASMKDQSLKDASMRDRSLKDASMKDRSIKDRSARERRAAANDDSSSSDGSDKFNAPSRGSDFGTNHSRSLQGIHKLLGTMGKDATAKDKEKAAEKEKAEKAAAMEKIQKERVQRRLQGHQAMKTGISKEEEVPAAKQMAEDQDPNKRRLARVEASKISEEEKNMPALPAEEDDENDYDTVATPKTATDAPLPPMKEAPPPPQRRNVARKPRNQLPNLGPPKAPTSSFRSAPPQVPATPMKSPGGFVIEVQNPAATPIAGCSTPQQNLTTPQAVTMPVMPNNDFDSVATPRTVGDVAPPPITNAPPPPPKRNMDMGSRWKNRQASRVPTMPGQEVCATPAATKAPTMNMLSPGGIVIEVNSKKSGIKGPNRPPEPMTPMAEMTPMTSKSGTLSNSPHYNALRNTMNSRGPIVPSTPAMERSGILTEMSTPSMQSNSGDISELTPGTFVGRMTPRDRNDGTVPSTPSLYNSPGVISELTPGGYSVGLYGDDDYQGTAGTPVMATPSMPSRIGVISELTPRTYGILLEEEDEDEANFGDFNTTPTTPSLQSPAGVVSELTPGTHGYNVVNLDSEGVGPLPVPSTPSVNSQAGVVSELTPGSKGPVPSTPSVHTPSGVVSELTPTSSDGSRRTGRMLSNLSNHSGVVSDITPGSFSTGGSAGQVEIAG